MPCDVSSPVLPPTPPRKRRLLFSVLLWMLNLLVLFIAAMCTLATWTDSLRGQMRAMLDAGEAPARAIGYAMGANFFNGMLLLVGLVLLARRRRIRGTITCVAAAGLGLAATVGLLTGAQRLSASEVDRMRNNLASALEGVASEGVVGDAPSGELGSGAGFVGVMREHMEKVQGARRGYQLRVLELRIGNVLLPIRLDSAEEIADSRRRVHEAEEAFELVREEVDAIIADTKSRLSKAAPPGDDPDEIVRGFELGRRRLRAAEERYHQYESEAFDGLHAILDLCESEVDALQLQGDILVFGTDAAAVRYNMEVGRLQELVRRQSKIAELIASDQAESARRLRAGGNQAPRPAPYAGPNGDVFTVDRSGIALNEQRIGVPRTVAELRLAFGEPDRIEPVEHLQAYLWDELGVAAEAGVQQQVLWLTLTTNVLLEGEGATEPTNPFGGVIELFGVEVSDVDNPLSLNRRLDEERFDMDDAGGSRWSISCDGFNIDLWVWSSGMIDGVTITPVRDEPPVEAKPRF